MKPWYSSLPNNGELVAKYDSIGALQNKRAVVSKNQLKGYIDENGKEVIPLQYEIAIGFTDKKAHVMKDGVILLINTDGIVI